MHKKTNTHAFFCALFLCGVTLLQGSLDEFMALSGGMNDESLSNMLGGKWDDASLDSLFGGGSDFGFDDKFDFGDSNDFGDLFGEGSTKSSSYKTNDSPAKAEKKAVLPSAAASLKEAFEQGIKPEVQKLTKQYKEALEKYLTAAITAINDLQKHTNSFVLGARLRQKVKEAGAFVAVLVPIMERLKNEKVFHVVLLGKDLAVTRKKLMTLPAKIKPLLTEYTALAGILDDSIKAKTTTEQQKRQKALAAKIESLITKELKPLEAPLTKLLEDKKVQEAVKGKQKKYAGKAQDNLKHKNPDNYSAYAGGRGGDWGSGNDYWNSGDSFDDFGSASDFGNFGGGSDDWGWSGGYGSGQGYDDWSSEGFGSGGFSGSSGSGSISSSIGDTYGAGPAARSSSLLKDESDWSPDAGETDTSDTQHTTASKTPAEEDLSALTPSEQYNKLLTTLPWRINQWRARYERAAGFNEKQALLKTILADPAFGTMAHHLALFTTLASKAHEQDEACSNAVLSAIPLLVGAAAYASPALEYIQDAQEKMTLPGITAQAAKEKIKRDLYQRERSYKALLQWLKALRDNRGASPVAYEKVIDELLSHTEKVFDGLHSILKEARAVETGSPLKFLMGLTSLSRQLFHEPVVIGYAVLSEESENVPTKRKERLAGLIAKKDALTKEMVPFVQNLYTTMPTEADNNTKALIVELMQLWTPGDLPAGEQSAAEEGDDLTQPEDLQEPEDNEDTPLPD